MIVDYTNLYGYGIGPWWGYGGLYPDHSHHGALYPPVWRCTYNAVITDGTLLVEAGFITVEVNDTTIGNISDWWGKLNAWNTLISIKDSGGTYHMGVISGDYISGWTFHKLA